MHRVSFVQLFTGSLSCLVEISSISYQFVFTDLPRCPLLSKVQMIKCEKCSRDLCSRLNHRRHIQVQHGLLNFEKVFFAELIFQSVTINSCVFAHALCHIQLCICLQFKFLVRFIVKSCFFYPFDVLQEDSLKKRVDVAEFWDKVAYTLVLRYFSSWVIFYQFALLKPQSTTLLNGSFIWEYASFCG